MAKHIAFSSRVSGGCEDLLGAPSHTCTGKPPPSQWPRRWDARLFPVGDRRSERQRPFARSGLWETASFIPVPPQRSQTCLPHPFAGPGPPCRLFPIKLSRFLSHPFLLSCAMLSQDHWLWGIISVGLVLMIGFVTCERTSLASGRCTAPVCLSRRCMRNRQDY